MLLKKNQKVKGQIGFDTIYYRKLIYEIYNRKDNSFFFRLLEREDKLLPKEKELIENLLDKETEITADESREKDLIWKQLSQKIQISVRTNRQRQIAIRSYAVAASVVFILH